MWYAVDMLIKSECYPDASASSLWEEVVILVSSSSKSSARKKAQKFGRRYECDYEVVKPSGNRLKWTFEHIKNIKTLDVDTFVDGLEISSRFLVDRKNDGRLKFWRSRRRGANFVDMSALSKADGKVKWYSFDLFFKSICSLKSNSIPTWEEKIVIVSAKNMCAAKVKAVKWARRQEVVYDLEPKGSVRWKFMDGNSIAWVESNKFSDGLEVFSRFLRERKS